MINILLVGSLPPPIGGTTVSFKTLVDNLSDHTEANISVVDLSSGLSVKGLKSVKVKLLLLFKLFKSIKATDVVTLHVSIGSLRLIGPFVLLLCKLLGKPLVVRRFGGVLIKECSRTSRLILNMVYKYSDAGLLQTKTQLEEAKSLMSYANWFPTSRNAPSFQCSVSNQCSKFLFLSQVKKNKGVFDLINAFGKYRNINKNVTLDIYGPLFDDIKEEDLAFDGINYRGVVSSGNIYEVINKHDILVLPTFYEGEGYPGIIIEAMHCGKPIITTNWKNIPEVVDESCALIFNPQDVDSLYFHIKDVVENSDAYRGLCLGSKLRAREFDSKLMTNKFLDVCNIVLKGKK
ncbi:glycosyltransferase family 4 protein [Vibrio breoganii]|uniref:glycosyltransferase family 4 protein n=1 Tax=Vibrio breoganii TaxID=553239 RepID=UPI000317339A|nr:glycosyltransferase family 4 protein [Vibrio breoganii]OED98587.1 hypothetical protein A1QE_00965 [Vibrio breoganii ZF-55]